MPPPERFEPLAVEHTARKGARYGFGSSEHRECVGMIQSSPPDQPRNSAKRFRFGLSARFDYRPFRTTILLHYYGRRRLRRPRGSACGIRWQDSAA